jgi:hypothetical protein
MLALHRGDIFMSSVGQGIQFTVSSVGDTMQ